MWELCYLNAQVYQAFFICLPALGNRASVIHSVPNTGRSVKIFMINFCIGIFLKLEWHLSILQRK